MAKKLTPKRSQQQVTWQQKLYLPCLITSALIIIGVAVMPWLGTVGMASPKNANGIGLWINFLGELHPLFLHLPIGALLLVAVMEMGRLFSKGEYQPPTTLGLLFTAITAVFAVVFGYFLYLTGSFEGEVIEEHKRDGIIFTILAILTFLIKYSSDLKPEKKIFKPLYAITFLASLASMIAAGHHGGEYTHGDPIDSLPSAVLEKRQAKQAEDDQKASVDLTHLVVYTEIIHPILEEKCISCHGPQKKKSGLRMDTYEYLLEGGDEDECLVPGDLKSSGMITTLHLPLDDDLRMPPPDETQLTTEEINLLEWWVRIGAPEKAKLSEVETTPEIDQALEAIFRK